jgi:hypothetical protein
MLAPARDQVRLAREYVASSTGLAAIRSRTASVAGELPAASGAPSLPERSTRQQ